MNIIDKNSRVLILGGSGILGSAVQRKLKTEEYYGVKVYAPTHNTLELHDMKAVMDAYDAIQPTHIINCSALVGGVGMDDDKNNAHYFIENFMLQFEPMYATGILKKNYVFVNVSSICAYPKNAQQPLRESDIFSGAFDTVNEGYSLAKAVGVKYGGYLKKQFGRNIISVIPCNMYGTNDNFHRPPLHVVASLVKKYCDAVNKDEVVTLWGDGTPIRDFLHSDDMADGLLKATQFYEGNSAVNIGSGSQTRIKDLSLLIGSLTGFKNETLWDTSKPNGTPAKHLDISILKSLGWSPKISLEEGLTQMIAQYREKYLACRPD